MTHKDCNYKPDGTGVVMGDDKAMPDRGTSVGWHGAKPMLEDHDTGVDSINRIGGIGNATKSDSESTSFGGDTTV